jgi:diaminopimelate decarboxylase
MFSADTLLRFQNTQTPFYYYNVEVLTATLAAAAKAAGQYNYHVHYALKANSNPQVLNLMGQYGFGADCVSGGEVQRAVECGFAGNKIVFAGVGKADDEINLALKNDIFCFNVESVAELEVLNELAAAAGKTARVALRINPNVNANTHKYITTGLEENKFGINVWELDAVLNLLQTLQNIEFLGLHFHIGSQITDLSVFKNLCLKVNELNRYLADKRIPCKILNVGGGLGINYHEPDTQAIPDFEAYFGLFSQFLEVIPGQEVHFELGRALVAQCGSLITKVLYIKNGIKTNFAIVDAGMNNLIRPALYQAYHKIENISNAAAVTDKYDVVGPICESSDCFGKAVALPPTVRGHLVAIRSAGAYGQVMASDYNLKHRAEAIYSTPIED